MCENGETEMDFLIRFALSHPDIGTVIVGTKSIEHLRDNIQAAEKGVLSEEIYEEAKRRLSQAGINPL